MVNTFGQHKLLTYFQVKMLVLISILIGLEAMLGKNIVKKWIRPCRNEADLMDSRINN